MTTTDRQITHALVFPTSMPKGAVHAHVDPTKRIDALLTWSIQTLNAGPPRSSSIYDQHLRDTVGSSYDWSDELRFDKRTGELVSFVLKTPETGTVDPGIASSWLALPRQPGIPVLDQRDAGFHVDPLDLRYLSGDGAELIVTDANLKVANGSSLRLAVGADVDLLFHAGRYGGWILENPIAHLVEEPGHALVEADEPRLHELLRVYLALVVEPNITRMSDEDPEMRKALQDLLARVRAVSGVRAQALGNIIDGVLEAFYPE